jgi:hypothetical protein
MQALPLPMQVQPVCVNLYLILTSKMKENSLFYSTTGSSLCEFLILTSKMKENSLFYSTTGSSLCEFFQMLQCDIGSYHAVLVHNHKMGVF